MRKSNLLDLRWPTCVNFINFAACSLTLLWMGASGARAAHPPGPSDQPEAYFNGSAYIRLVQTLSLHSFAGVSFRSCVGGELFSQRYEGHTVQVSALPEAVLAAFVTPAGGRREFAARLRALDNAWHFVALRYDAAGAGGPRLLLTVDRDHTVTIANATYNGELLSARALESPAAVLLVGNMFSGCMREGPGLAFRFEQQQGVEFGPCPLTTSRCKDRKDVLTNPPSDNCFHEPCLGHGTCISRRDDYECHCTARYSGKNCEIDVGPPCQSAPCANGGRCEESKLGDYICQCTPDYYGPQCQFEVSVNPLCASKPCRHNGSCQVPPNSDHYICTCQPGYAGTNCDTDVDECEGAGVGACAHGGRCVDSANNYTCDCTGTGYTGPRCDVNVNECLEGSASTCNGRGVCFDTYGSYVCLCDDGYAGDRCQYKQSPCASVTCANGGTCIVTAAGPTCQCARGWAGPTCVRRAACTDAVCPPRSRCVEVGGGGVTVAGVVVNQGKYAQCVCEQGYYGAPGPSPNCTSLAAVCQTAPCLNGGTCDVNLQLNTFNCSCLPGYVGPYCEHKVSKAMPDGGKPTPSGSDAPLRCIDKPCLHALACNDYSNGYYYCECETGWAGKNCDVSAPPCALPDYCKNGGQCVMMGGAVRCHCAAGFTGNYCEYPITPVSPPPASVEPCAARPCKNGGMCRTRRSAPEESVAAPVSDFTCECRPGFEGALCEQKKPDCRTMACRTGQECIELLNGQHKCRCPEGKVGLNCETPITGPCASSPCNNGTCQDSGSDNFTCTCDDGFTGRFCEEDIDECITMPNICNEGICVNGKPGGFQCYCTPGYTGEYCEIDFDECLSHPCKNNGTCENKVNNYECKCTPGFSNKDCSVNIDECSWKPCAEGATCIDGVADYTCVCPDGLTGKQCQVDIDDCQSQPCLHGGRCRDARNGYTCDCEGTGFAGPECGVNVDECVSHPCRNDASCIDLVNDYSCRCHPGYIGKNCEQDIQECDSQPCQFSGVCLEHSNASLYIPPPATPATHPVQVGSEPNMLLPAVFYNTFSYTNASGFECVCVAGVTGAVCSVNINECESSPCGPLSTCVDGVGRYMCDCADGFEGTHCETEIDECERYHPCAHGRCRDRRADYKCECEEGWGGRNCSVALAGCEGAPCRHAGVCFPFLEGETVHRFRCTCAPGYHGTTCEKITTMSLGGNSYIWVNKSREEGYDIQFRFKTTLSDGLLAIGKGFTYYILELAHGRLNLHSSLLNKWEGVYIGSNLNDSRWQKVFVAINSTHVVLAANEEQTIYPINLNEGSNSSHTAFPTTFVGGTVPSLAGLTHGPSYFVGCFQDVTINGEWVLPENHPQPDVVPLPPASSTATWALNGVRATCPRTPQCAPNPCFSGGTCEDLWTNFRCTCQRPFLGHTCQYNLTAATFGYEGARFPSVVTVEVNEAARKAVRSVLDISMFIRTRQSTGLIFYLGSRPKLGSFDETSVAASLEGGELLVHLRFNQTPEDYTVGGTRLDNAYLHLIQVVRNSTLVQVKLNGTEYFRKSISAAKQLDAQVLYLGGKPSPPIPPPVTIIPTTVAAETGSRGVRSPQVPAPPADLPAPPASENFFKGIIQDVQVSNGPHTMIVEFFPLNVPDLELPLPFGMVSFDEAAVFQGVVSDDSCRSAPCLHNGTCRVTWNDFMCVCPRGYKGKSCDEMEFCQLQDCPVNSVCRNLDGGYECLAKATFDGLNTTLSYKLDSGARTVSSNELTPPLSLPKLDSLQLTYRSKSGGTLLQAVHAASGSSFSLAVYRDQVAAEWKLGGAESQPSIRRFKKDVPDYDWTTIVLTVTDGVIKGGFYDWQKDDSPAFTADIDSVAWSDLMAQGTIYLGGVRTFQDPSTAVVDLNGFNNNATGSGEFGATQFGAKNMYLTDSTATLSSYTNRNGAQLDSATEPDIWDMTNGERLNVDSSLGENFKGCIGEVRIGGLLLPFFTPDELYIGPALALISSSTHFTLQRSRRGDPYEKLGCVLCFERDCRNGGHCADLASDYACRCPPGYAEDDCSVDVDECIGADCKNGATCVDGVANYTCQCASGWEGWQCDTNIDECASGPCAHGGTCVDRLGTFLCMCGPEWAGATCSLPRRLTCDHAPCARGATCADAVTDPKTGNNFTCICAPGFDGVLCDTPYCELRPCKHSGRCMVDQNPPVCVCAPGYTGARCETEVDECVLAGPAACQHGGRCIDQLATYSCDCSQTGYTGARCQQDVDECANPAVDCGTGVCVNLPGSYVCNCTEGFCGVQCALPDPCHSTAAGEDAPANASGPCLNGGLCVQRCAARVEYECECVDGWGGKNCTEQVVVSAAGSESSNTNAVIIGVVAALAALALAAGALLALAANARSKRATRGTYSPSSQEYCNPRLEMIDNALKPPPEERLI